MICIWDSNTGELLVGPIKDLGNTVTSVVWSSDSSKLYSASDEFARVFDSVSGTQLHRFEHNHWLYSIALSPKYNVLACVGSEGTAQLWDTESYQPLGEPFSPDDSVYLFCVSFSRDGRYLAYGGSEKISLWMVKDVAPTLPVSAFATMRQLQGDKLYNRILGPGSTSVPFIRPITAFANAIIIGLCDVDKACSMLCARSLSLLLPQLFPGEPRVFLQVPCTTWQRLVNGGYIIASGVCSYTTCKRLVPGRWIFAG